MLCNVMQLNPPPVAQSAVCFVEDNFKHCQIHKNREIQVKLNVSPNILKELSCEVFESVI